MTPETDNDSNTVPERLLGAIFLFIVGFAIAMTMCLVGH